MDNATLRSQLHTAVPLAEIAKANLAREGEVMMNRPTTGSQHRSALTGRMIRVTDVQGDIIVVVDHDGNRSHTHIRDFNAEYRLLQQRRALA
jgi:hypothetical protein